MNQYLLSQQMNELTAYRKALLRKKLSRINDYFSKTGQKVAAKNRIIRIAYAFLTQVLKGFFGICLYGEYITWKFKDFTFDAHFMDYQIQRRGYTTEEAIKFLTEQKIKLKEYIYRKVVSKKEQSNAEKSLDYLFTKYNARKGDKASPFIAKKHADWMSVVWDNLLEKKCIVNEQKSDFILLMTGNTPINKLIWCKGVIKLVQFVEEGLEINKIPYEGFVGRDEYILEYIIANFRPNPNLPNQKLEHYTGERIKNAQNEYLKIKPKDRVKEFFVFEQKYKNI